MNIGDKVKVKDQCITGVIVGYDCGNKVFVRDDFPEWDDEDGDGELVFNMSDLIVIDEYDDALNQHRDYPYGDIES